MFNQSPPRDQCDQDIFRGLGLVGALRIPPDVCENFPRRRFCFFRRGGEFLRQRPDEISVSFDAVVDGCSVSVGDSLKYRRELCLLNRWKC